jgi:hypothetical protein
MRQDSISKTTYCIRFEITDEKGRAKLQAVLEVQLRARAPLPQAVTYIVIMRTALSRKEMATHKHGFGSKEERYRSGCF